MASGVGLAFHASTPRIRRIRSGSITKKPSVGLCGAVIGSHIASIAISRAGTRVTVLEAASRLGEVYNIAQRLCN